MVRDGITSSGRSRQVNVAGLVRPVQEGLRWPPQHDAPGAGRARVHVQRFGTFLSNMIMPNIGAIIAWGLITAFFIDVGWTPNEKIATMVGPPSPTCCRS